MPRELVCVRTLLLSVKMEVDSLRVFQQKGLSKGVTPFGDKREKMAGPACEL